MKDLKLAGATVLAIVAVIFVLQNTESVDVEFLLWTWTASRAFALLLVFLVGVAVGWLGRAGTRRRR